jgi:magnesium-transporting ATPase (P-type)
VSAADAPAAEPLVNGLHVDDALNAAKHAVQELWVPKRKPTPGGFSWWCWHGWSILATIMIITLAIWRFFDMQFPWQALRYSMQSDQFTDSCCQWC